MRLIRALLLGFGVSLASLVWAETTPTDVVRSTADEVIERLRVSQPLDDEQAYTLVEEMILPHLDFATFARLTLGKHWRQASPEQRTAFTEGFRDLLMRTYATSLNAYSGERIEHTGQRDEGDGRVLVQTQVIRPQGPPVLVDFRLQRNNETWLVYDVVIEGVSLIINYRSNFGEEISRNGLDALIQHMIDHKAKAICIGGVEKGCR
jgi:phospholipid transport system substrate-binding protein